MVTLTGRLGEVIHSKDWLRAQRKAAKRGQKSQSILKEEQSNCHYQRTVIAEEPNVQNNTKLNQVKAGYC